MKKFLLPILLTTAAALPGKASVIITYAEDPSSYNSKLSGTQVFDFNTTALGENKDVSWKGVGTFDYLFVKSIDSYGGALEASKVSSQYSLQGAGTQVLNSTLKLDTASSYFGMWWSAGDPHNVLDFYLGDDLVSQFTTKSLMDPLPDEYDGNPRNRKINSSEPYAFINFFGDATTMWDRIVLRNIDNSGFESDNYTTRVEAWDPKLDGALPGIPVALVSGSTTTLVTEKSLDGTRWTLNESSAGAVPGAPVPPWSLLVAFALVAVIRRGKQGAAA